MTHHRNHIVCSFLLTLLYFIGYTQNKNLDFQLLFSCKEKAELINCDKLGYIYLSNGTNIYKYNQKGEQLCLYSNLKKGKISNIDTYNPMKILVFSKDFLQLTFLDNYLSPLNFISGNLADYNLYQPTLICASHDNGFWVYDDVAEQLFRFDYQGKPTNESISFSQITTEKIIPIQMKESESGYIIVNDSNSGFFIFDQFGTYIKQLPIPKIEHFDIYSDLIVYCKEAQLVALNLNTLNQQVVSLPQNDIHIVAIQDNIIVCLNTEGNVSVYLWTPTN